MCKSHLVLLKSDAALLNSMAGIVLPPQLSINAVQCVNFVIDSSGLWQLKLQVENESTGAGPSRESGSTGEELVKFRLVGKELLMYCKRLTKATSLQWKWVSSDLKSTGTISLENNTIISEQSFLSRLYFAPDSALKLLPVTFGDAGKYECNFSDHIGKTIHLITIKVTANPSTEVFQGHPVSLTCSLSHPLPKNDIVLVWAKTSQISSVLIKSHIVKNEETNISVLVEGDNMENTTWTCIVFHERTLVAFIPIELQYKYNAYQLTTNIYKASALNPNIDEEGINENSQLNIVYLLRSICLPSVFVASILIICRTVKQKYTEVPAV
ncbi:uncharacterized protein ACMZJ9_004757 [Mantella aurantiaca]